MVTFVKLPSLNIEDIYESKQSSHLGWRLRVVKIGTQHVECVPLKGNEAARHKAHTRNGLFSYHIDQFRRDFMLVNAAITTGELYPDMNEETESNNTLQCVEPETKVCNNCGQYKSLLEGFGKLPRGEGYFTTCKSCREQKRQATLAAKKLNLQPELAPQPDHDTIAIRLMDIAKEVEKLGTPPTLIELAKAVRNVLLDATEAGTVAVIPMEQFIVLQGVFNSIKGSITSWE